MAGDTEETGINQENENHPDSFNSEDNQNRFGAGWVKEYPDSKQNDLETEYIPVDTMDPEKLAIPQKENSSNHPLIDKLKVETENNIVKNQLPFFSKVNLTRAYENLSQRGFRVKVGGAAKVNRDVA